MRRTDLTGTFGKWKNNSAPHYPGILDSFSHQYQKGQTVMLLYFVGAELHSHKEIVIEEIKFDVLSTTAGCFKKGVHCSAWDFNQPHYDGKVTYYSNGTPTKYFILPLDVFKKVTSTPSVPLSELSR